MKGNRVATLEILLGQRSIAFVNLEGQVLLSETPSMALGVHPNDDLSSFLLERVGIAT